MAVATLPSPLYGLYRIQDHLSALAITVVYAIFAGSTIATLQRDSSIAARIGRRGMMLGAVAMMMVAVGVLAVWKDLPGLLIGRLLTGVSVGLAAGIAITYLIELRLRADPKESAIRARTIGTSVTVGALGVGPLIAGCLAQWVTQPLTVPRSGCERRACSPSGRSPCSLVWCCSSFPCAFPRRASRCS
jgi:MFS family permease